MARSFGAYMRQQREERQIGLAAIVEKTKIKQSLLEAMERDDLSQWPNGFFRRAFIRAYAQAIGLEPDEVVRQFLHFHGEQTEPPREPASIAAAEDGRAGGAPPTRLRQMVGSAVTRLRSNSPRPATASDHGQAATPARPLPRRVVFETELVPVGDLLALANLCAKLGRTKRTDNLSPMLQEGARILDAVGLIVWTWDGSTERLRASWAHGYADSVLLQLPLVPLEAENAVAAAFRSSRSSYVVGGDSACNAIAVPLLTAKGCVGVLATELEPSGEVPSRVEALATIIAAQLARIVEEPLQSPESDRPVGDPALVSDSLGDTTTDLVGHA